MRGKKIQQAWKTAHPVRPAMEADLLFWNIFNSVFNTVCLSCRRLNMNAVIVFWHQPAQSADVPKGVEDDEESEADPGEEEHAHTLPRTQTNISECVISFILET